MEFMRFRRMKAKESDEPEEIYEKLIETRKKLLSGFPGDGITNLKKQRESLKPTHYAISLSGEPTLYPKLPQLIRFLKSRPGMKSVFVVTNGMEPSMFERMEGEGLPTQLYVSVNAPNKELFKKINRPMYKDGWERFLRSLAIFSRLKTRRVLRLTMIRGMNMDFSFVRQYADLIKKANPHFIEVKAYMWIGFSRKRLKEENMPSHSEVKKFAIGIEKSTDFEIADEKEDSRVVLLQNKKERIERFIK
jgi:tRNA wybutosine-synthesizing protein 1